MSRVPNLTTRGRKHVRREGGGYLLVVWRHSFSPRSLSTTARTPAQDGPLICRAVEPLFAVYAGTANSSFDTF